MPYIVTDDMRATLRYYNAAREALREARREADRAYVRHFIHHSMCLDEYEHVCCELSAAQTAAMYAKQQWDQLMKEIRTRPQDPWVAICPCQYGPHCEHQCWAD